MTTHHLKCHPEPFQAMKAGLKPWEFRHERDRVYAVGDILFLEEWNPVTQEYSDEALLAFKVIFLLRGPQFGIQKGHVCMSLNPVTVKS